MPGSHGFWRLLPAALLAPVDPAQPESVGPRTGRDWVVDIAAFVVAAAAGAALLGSSGQDSLDPLTTPQLVVDVVLGSLCCLLLWWRRRWPLAVALASVLVGTLSTSASAAQLLALSSLAVHRSVRPVLGVAALWAPTAIICSIYRGGDPAAAVRVTIPIVIAAVAWGMFVRARRQLLFTLRERALRAEADQILRADSARMAERNRIAREMHDVLAHRISLVALHAGALEVRPDLPPTQIQQTAALLRSTARQALEELRDVIGVLREEPGQEAPTSPQPTLTDIPRLVEETRRAGVRIDFEMRVDNPDAAPGALGRDAYRIVQEALTNLGKHARSTEGRVRVSGAPDRGLHVSVRNRLSVRVPTGPALPGAGAGLLGLQERVTLAGGVLVHGPDGAGNFVVEADLRW